MTACVDDPTVRSPAALGRRGGVLLLAAFVLSWFGALIVTAPSSLVRAPTGVLPAGATLTPQSGTLWQGRWRLDLPQGVSLRLTARFIPGALLHGRLSWRVGVQGAGLQSEGVVTPGRDGVSVDHVRAQLAADGPLMQLVTPWSLGGTLRGTGSAHFRQTDRGLSPANATISFQWQAARLTTTEPLSLGDLALSARLEHDDLVGKVIAQPSASAPLEGTLTLRGPLTPRQQVKIQGFLEATSYASAALRQQLGLLGRPNDQGRFSIDGYLPGR